MTQSQFNQMRIAFAILAVMIVGVFCHGVDHASCLRSNSARQIEASNLRNAANTVKTITPARKTFDLKSARQLHSLDCSIPFPQTP